MKERLSPEPLDCLGMGLGESLHRRFPGAWGLVSNGTAHGWEHQLVRVPLRVRLELLVDPTSCHLQRTSEQRHGSLSLLTLPTLRCSEAFRLAVETSVAHEHVRSVTIEMHVLQVKAVDLVQS
jgi:hypothetical protein